MEPVDASATTQSATHRRARGFLRVPAAVAVAAMTVAGVVSTVVATVSAGPASALLSCTTLVSPGGTSLGTALSPDTCPVIEVAPGTYAGTFTIARSVTIIGAGEGYTILKGGTPVVTDTSATGPVELDNLTITGGVGTGATDTGAGITDTSASTLTLNHVLVTKNTNVYSCSSGGCAAGGIFSGNGATNIENSAITLNTAGGPEAGGIVNSGTAMTISNSVVSQNTDPLSGGPGADAGGIENTTVLKIYQSAITDNSGFATAGVLNYGTMLYLSGTSVTGNHATNQGGGIWNTDGGTTTIEGGLIAYNTAGFGGGIYNQLGGTVNMTGGGIVYNSAPSGEGGGIDNLGTFNPSGTTINNNEVNDCSGSC